MIDADYISSSNGYSLGIVEQREKEAYLRGYKDGVRDATRPAQS